MTSCCLRWSLIFKSVVGFVGRSLYSRTPNYSDLCVLFWGTKTSLYFLLCVSIQLLSRVRLFETPMDCAWDFPGKTPVSSVHGVLQSRTLEWVAISSSRGSSQPRDRTQVSYIAGRLFTTWAIREAQKSSKMLFCVSLDGETGSYPKAALDFLPGLASPPFPN